MNLRNIVLTCTMLGFLVGCTENKLQYNAKNTKIYTQQEIQEIKTRMKSLEEKLQSGENIFIEYCGACHGRYGQFAEIEIKDKNDGEMVTVSIQGFSENGIWDRFTEGEIKDYIKNPPALMPKIKGVPKDGARQIANYLAHAKELEKLRHTYYHEIEKR